MIPDTTLIVSEAISQGGIDWAQVVMAVIAAGALIVAGMTVRGNDKTSKANLMNDLLKEWSSLEMQKAINEVNKLHASSFGKGNSPLAVFNKETIEADRTGVQSANLKNWDECRRKMSHHYHRIASLKELGYINKNVMKKVYPKDKHKLYMDKVKPLDEIVRTVNSVETPFDTVLLKFYKKKIFQMKTP